ncbi:MAG: cytidylate kinase [Sphingomonas sp. 12-62-6]|nr:MAG: cytidylate kinase [Sphingomonas sp. 12-62-6]
MIIAVDGPAASGKGTIARALAKHYGLPHLDTGLLYRAVALTVVRNELNPDIEADCFAACDFDESVLADPELRTDEIGKIASIVSAHPLVRTALLHRQRRFANQPGGAVLDGAVVSIDKVLADIRARDLRDSQRATAPLVLANDAALLDTSFLSIESAIQRAIELVEARTRVKTATS